MGFGVTGAVSPQQHQHIWIGLLCVTHFLLMRHDWNSAGLRRIKMSNIYLSNWIFTTRDGNVKGGNTEEGGQISAESKIVINSLEKDQKSLVVAAA